MEVKTTEEFQQEILKTIKLKNMSVNIYLSAECALQYFRLV